MKRKLFTHCWHVTSSTTNGMGITGYDDVICCHCGAKEQREWRWDSSPDHGPHVDERDRTNTPVNISTKCNRVKGVPCPE